MLVFQTLVENNTLFNERIMMAIIQEDEDVEMKSCRRVVESSE
jgi:hypothetical protein